ncbi:hypothetical protein [Alkalinema sp. FACHB-956]|uniref:hypothetical protein n=1 Tax=Alkalinema sp. FACHB-956 TaxID=2692768 RepID=UPI001685B58C|nr:hypothetical protein [Alkalinema sp. FACHB-956]MBD2329572.1 hypothetical protein [Alkalinema sp. FACHB-956]
MAAHQLSPIEQLRLVRQLVGDMEAAMSAGERQPRVSSLGALAHLGQAPSEEEIDKVRREMAGY